VNEHPRRDTQCHRPGGPGIAPPEQQGLGRGRADGHGGTPDHHRAESRDHAAAPAERRRTSPPDREQIRDGARRRFSSDWTVEAVSFRALPAVDRLSDRPRSGSAQARTGDRTSARSGTILGRRFLPARQRSNAACRASHDSADPPSAVARRMASSALTAARPLTTRESATRDTPRRPKA
jgi:hypothetical protein